MEMEKGNLVFKNHLITKFILKNLDTESIKNCRLLCKNAAEVGAQIFANYRNPLYFKFYESIWFNKKIIDEHNNKKLEWLEAQLEKDPEYWVMKAMEIPFFDWNRNLKIYMFISKNGHLLNDLRLVYQRRCEKFSGIYFDDIVDRERTFLGPVLFEFCQNLKRVTVIDSLREPNDNNIYDDHEFTIEQHPLEYLSLVYDPHVYFQQEEGHGKDGFPLGMENDFIIKVLKGCPNLKVLKLVPCYHEINSLTPMLKTMQKEKFVFKSLEALALGPKVDLETLGFITENTFPSLLTLQLQTHNGYLSNIPQSNIIYSPKNLKTLILSLKGLDNDDDKDVSLDVGNVLKLFPSIEHFEISYINEEGLHPMLPLKVYASSASFLNVKIFTTFARVYVDKLDPFLEAIFKIFPNLEKLNILDLCVYGIEGEANFTKLEKFEKLTELNVEWFISINEKFIVSEDNIRVICSTLKTISMNGINKRESYPHVLHPLDYSDLKKAYLII